MKLNHYQVSAEVPDIAIDVRYNLNDKKMLNIQTELLEWGLETSHFKYFFLKSKPYDPTIKFKDFLSENNCLLT